MNSQDTMILNNEIQTLKSNEIVKDFVEAEAYNKIASDIANIPGH